MKKITAMILCMSVFFLCGCRDYSDTENMSYVTAVTVDVGSGAQYEYCFQFVNPLSDEGEFVTYSAQGDTLYTAVNRISEQLTRKISFTHIKMVAVSQEAAKSMDKAVAGFNASRFYRPDIMLAVVFGEKASAMFEEINPELEGNAARYYDLAFTSENSLAKTVTTVKDYFSHNSCVLPLIAGSAINGIAIIKNGSLIALGDRDDAICYNLLTKGTKQSIFSDSMITSNPPSMYEYWKDGAPVVDYTVTVDISPLSSEKNIEEVKYELESRLYTFVKKCTRDYKADIFNHERLFKKYFMTEEDWEKQHWDKCLERLAVHVSVVATETKRGRSAVN